MALTSSHPQEVLAELAWFGRLLPVLLHRGLYARVSSSRMACRQIAHVEYHNGVYDCHGQT